METKDKVAEEIQKYILSILACEKGIDLGGFAIQNLRVSVHRDLYEHQVLYALHTLIPAESMKKETHTFEVSYPSDWKQALKKRFFPMWLKKRYPIKYKKITKRVKFTAYNLYPKFPVWHPKGTANAVQTIVKSPDICEFGWEWRDK